ncbi:MAG: hypothetical protein M1833_007330 [Piccolia ochrophora]|nr:MAG: hypothetical protein M1833_007330 [Piccolia ochrophora]
MTTSPQVPSSGGPLDSSPPGAPSSSTTTTTDPTAQWATVKHNLSLALLIACPALIAVPPRKLDFYTFSLAAAWTASVNQLTVERSGRGILAHLDARRVSAAAKGERDPGRATEAPAGLMRREEQTERKGLMDKMWLGDEPPGWKERRAVEEKEALEEGGKGYSGLILDQVWDVWTWGKGQEKARQEGAEGGSGPCEDEAARRRDDN